MFEVFLLTYQRFLEVLFSHSITKTLRFLLTKKRSPGHFSIKTKRLTESSPLLAFDAKAEKSRSLVTAYATLQRRFGYQVWLLPFDQYSALLECCVVNSLCSSFATVRRQISSNKDIKQLQGFFLNRKQKILKRQNCHFNVCPASHRPCTTSFVLVKLKRELFSSYEIS